MKTSSFRNFFWIVALSFLPVMSSCSGASDSPDDDDEENTVITAPFSGMECLFYQIEIHYYDSAGDEIEVPSNFIYSDDNINNWTEPGLKKAYLPFDEYYSATYQVEGLSDEIRQEMIGLEIWDIGEPYTQFTIDESMITSVDD